MKNPNAKPMPLDTENLLNRLRQGSPTERMHALRFEIIRLHPTRDLKDKAKHRAAQYQLPHISEHQKMVSELEAQLSDRHTDSMATAWEERLTRYAAHRKETAAWPVLILDPSTLTPGSEPARLLGTFLKAALGDKNFICIPPKVNIPFEGKQLYSTHYLIPRHRVAKNPCVDVVSKKELDRGVHASINEVIAVLHFNDQHELISTTPPKHARVYKRSKNSQTFGNEYLRSESVDYLNPKNYLGTLFSMRKIPGVNLKQYMETLSSMEPETRFKTCLVLAWRCYEALDRMVANNDHIQYHGDLSPTNIMVEEQSNTLSIKIIDFDTAPYTRLYSPNENQYKDILKTSKHDTYGIGRILARAFGDTHPIWSSNKLSEYHNFLRQPTANLLSHLFSGFDEAAKNQFAPPALIETLKETFRQIHELDLNPYPSAMTLQIQFARLYDDYLAHVATQREQNDVTSPPSIHPSH